MGPGAVPETPAVSTAVPSGVAAGADFGASAAFCVDEDEEDDDDDEVDEDGKGWHFAGAAAGVGAASEGNEAEPRAVSENPAVSTAVLSGVAAEVA